MLTQMCVPQLAQVQTYLRPSVKPPTASPSQILPGSIGNGPSSWHPQATCIPNALIQPTQTCPRKHSGRDTLDRNDTWQRIQSCEEKTFRTFCRYFPTGSLSPFVHFHPFLSIVASPNH